VSIDLRTLPQAAANLRLELTIWVLSTNFKSGGIYFKLLHLLGYMNVCCLSAW